MAVRRTPETLASIHTGTMTRKVQLEDDASKHVYLPIVHVQGSGPPYRLHTLFLQARRTTLPHDDFAQYRSNDGGRSWQSMEMPTVRWRAFLPLLGLRP